MNGEFGGGDGTQGAPYLVEDAIDLMALTSVNMGSYFKQTRNIDLSIVGNWEPLGTGEVPFIGHYDGQNYKITNLIVNTDKQLMGLFAFCLRSTLQNMIITNADIKGSYYSGRGGILAALLDSCEVIHCILSGSVENLEGNVGTLCCNFYNSSAERCSFNNVMVKGYQVGGIVTFAIDSSEVKDCYVQGELVGNGGPSYIGGIANNIYEGALFSNSYSVVKISNYQRVSSFVDPITTLTQEDAVIKGCYADVSFLQNDQWGGNDQWEGKSTYGNGAYGRGTNQMQTKENYVDWDFDDVWKIRENAYPELRSFSKVTCRVLTINNFMA